jgi:hypothetical protein
MRNLLKKLPVILTVGATLAAPIVAAAGGSSGTPFRPEMAEVSKAQSEIARVIAALRREFEESAELRQARDDLRQAGVNYRIACDAALAELRSSAAYRHAVERVRLGQRALDAARLDRDNQTTPKLIARLATELMHSRSSVSAMETAVLSKDPTVADAKYARIDANGRLIVLRRDFEASIQSSDEFQAARARLDAARSRIPQRR